MKKMTGKTMTTIKPIYYSTRVRLTAEQREKLKEAYDKIHDTGSELVSYDYSSARTIGIGDVAIKDLLLTRESVSIAVILRLQTSLGVEVISRNELIESFIEYLDYIFSPTFLNYDKADRVY